MDDIGTILELFKPLMTRCEELDETSYVCIFKTFKDAVTFVDAIKENVPTTQLLLKGLYVKIVVQ